MKIDLLDTPIRISWDLNGDDFSMEAALFDTVLSRVVTAQPFFVTLEQTPLLHPKIEEVLDRLHAASVQLYLTCDGSTAELQRLSELSPEQFSLILRVEPFITSQGIDTVRLSSVIDAVRDHSCEPAISLIPQKSNVEYLLQLISFCHENKVGRFKLPNVRIDDSFLRVGKGELLTSEDVEKLRQNFLASGSDWSGISPEIHDLFLWEVLAPDRMESRSEYGGCQAGNSLAHIKADGTVLPCLSWPVVIGDLSLESFADIWQSSGRHAIRKKIEKQPAGCVDCNDFQICFGGCRGLAETVGSTGGRDPMCGGPR